MRPAYAGTRHAIRSERQDPAFHGTHRQAVFEDAVVWITPNGSAQEAAVTLMRRLIRLLRLVPIYQEHNTSKKASASQELAILAEECGN